MKEYHWDSSQKKRIKLLLKDANPCFIGLSHSGKTSRLTDFSKENYDVIIGYCRDYNVYVVWNAYLRKQFGSASVPEKYIKNCKRIQYRYCSIHDCKGGVEKEVIIPADEIDIFCSHWLEHLQPNRKDTNYNPNVVWADENHPKPIQWEIYCDEHNTDGQRRLASDEERTKIIHQSYERNPCFSQQIKEIYGNRCAICRCDIPELLEAAHIVAVKDNGNDSVHNGICLCRNHHKAFDCGLLTIDFNNKEFSYTEDTLKEDDFSKFVFRKYGNKLWNKKCG